MKNLYIANNDKALANLNARYTALFTAFAAATAAKEEVKRCKSERINKGCLSVGEKGTNLFYQREHALFVAETRANDAIKLMHPLLQPLWEACQKARRFELNCRAFYENRYVLRANVITAEDLYKEGCNLYFSPSVSSGTWIRDEHYMAPPEEPREWVVLEQCRESGTRYHNSPSLDGCTPPFEPYMTKREANSVAFDWCKSMERDGGEAFLYNMRTRTKLDYKKARQEFPNWEEWLSSKS